MLPGHPKEQWVTVNWESYCWNFLCFCSRSSEMEKSSFFWNCLYLRENTSSNQFWRGRETTCKFYLEKWCDNSVGKVKHLLLKNNPVLRKNMYSYQLGYFILWGGGEKKKCLCYYMVNAFYIYFDNCMYGSIVQTSVELQRLGPCPVPWRVCSMPIVFWRRVFSQHTPAPPLTDIYTIPSDPVTVTGKQS